MLSVRDLRVTFHTADGTVQAVNGIDFDLRRGEILALVGESGSGKSVSSLSLAGLLPKTAQVGGSVVLDGSEILGASTARLKEVRRHKISYVFQDPISSLNPARRVGSQLEELLRVNRGLTGRDATSRAEELLGHVGIPGKNRQMNRYPHELSGGMCQRVMIAMALASEPEIIVADEATSSLDVSIQAQILELLERVRAETDTAMIMVTHDFGVVAGIADRVAVMYGGEIVESGPTNVILSHPEHPYTAALMMSAPDAEEQATDLFMIPGTLEEAREFAGTRCQFAPRCPLAFDRCWDEWPSLTERAHEHAAACHLEGEVVVSWRGRGGDVTVESRP
jgi:oligopeptide/dipeptide ABC transporter ATP-binding protein